MGRQRRNKHCKTMPVRKSKVQEFSVEKSRYAARRYEECHDKFLDYDGIKDYLCKIHRCYPQKVQLQVIGRSRQGRSIFMAIISCGGSAQQPKMATMIEAGSNGHELMTVSSALYLIDYLAKNQNLVKLMDYFIIPCSNPDAYECTVTNKRKFNVPMCLSHNFPVTLGTCGMESIRTEDFLQQLRCWKENYKCNAPETIALIKALAAYQFAIRMFISLRGNGTSITYPYGFCEIEPEDVNDLKKIAKAGQQGFRSRCFDVGTIYGVCGLDYGNIIDFLRTNRTSIKFVYVIQINKQDKQLDPNKITCYGQELMHCIRFMAKNVYMFYSQTTSKNNCKSSFCSVYLYAFHAHVLFLFFYSYLIISLMKLIIPIDFQDDN